MHELIEELLCYHHEKSGQLQTLQAAVDQLTERKSDLQARRLIADQLGLFQGDAETWHHANEELILRQLTTVEAPVHRRVALISADHEAFGRMVSNLIAMVADQRVSASALCASVENFIRHYDDHAKGEESIFFPQAQEILGPRDWQQIAADWHCEQPAKQPRMRS